MTVRNVWMQSLGSRMPLREIDIPKKHSKFKILLLLIILFCPVFLLSFHARCSVFADDTAGPISTAYTASTPNLAGAQYAYPEERTYLSYPQHFLVSTAAERADILTKGAPSEIPYFASIGQFWRGYCQVYGITSKYPRVDWRDNLSNMLTGMRISLAYGIEGAYEETFGRIFEAMSVAGETTEDKLDAKIADEVARFVAADQWYQFPYGEALVRLWRDTGIAGDSPARKIERRAILSIKYAGAGIAALVVRGITHVVGGGVPDPEIYSVVHHAPDNALAAVPFVRVVERLDGDRAVVAFPRGEHFTEVVPWLAYSGVEIDEIAGNDEILLSMRASEDWQYPAAQGRVVFELPVLTQYAMRSIGVQVPVPALSSVLRQLRNSTATLEQIYEF